MIERLVMRNEISHYKDLEQFTSQHGEFIAMVNHSFQRLKILYNVALPRRAGSNCRSKSSRRCWRGIGRTVAAAWEWSTIPRKTCGRTGTASG